MKKVAIVNLVLLVALLGSVATGCKRNPKKMTPIPGQAGAMAPGPNDGFDSNLSGIPMGEAPITDDLTGSVGSSDRGRATLDNSNQDRNQFSAQTVYFDFDSSVVKPSDIGKVETVAGYLQSNPSHSVLIEGHCDERGTEEYNRALGERRALSVRESLVSMGVSPDQVFTISYGEDVPADPGQNSEAYAKNRRGEFVLLTPR